MVLPATACTLDPLHVASEPRVAAYFADLVPVLGATTQVPGPLAFACCCQASLPLGGLLVAVGAVFQLQSRRPAGVLSTAAKASSKVLLSIFETAWARRVSVSTTISDTLLSALTIFSS